MPGVSLTHPPKRKIFRCFWGPTMPMEDDPGIGSTAPARRKPAKTAVPEPLSQAEAVATAVAVAIDRVTHPSRTGHAQRRNEPDAGDLSFSDADRFITILQLLANLQGADERRKLEREEYVVRRWTEHEAAFVAAGISHVGELTAWTSDMFMQHIRVPIGMAGVYVEAVKAEAKRVIQEKQEPAAAPM